VNDANPHAGASAFYECLAKSLADGVRPDPVHLEQDLAARARDDFEHRWKGLDAIAEQTHLVGTDSKPWGARVALALVIPRRGSARRFQR
jgi:hypothetical protein